MDQTLIDRFFGIANQSTISQKDLPTGVDRHTLKKVKELMGELRGGVSIEEMGEKMGAISNDCKKIFRVSRFDQFLHSKT